MASGIHRRTVLMEIDKRPVHDGATYIRPCDWARVDTSLGTMIEPFPELFVRHVVDTQSAAFDATDEMAKVNGIEFINMDSAQKILSFGEVHSVNVGIRTGR